MLSLASLLNPVAPVPPPPTPRHGPSPGWSSPNIPFSECQNLFFDGHHISSSSAAVTTSRSSKMTRDTGGFIKSKAKGTVNYPPFEKLDEVSMREIRRYQIYPFGKIQDYCRHVPYNSSKKDFHDKTGRESFEVFQYIFKDPKDGHEYTVMWDYNVGLVRMTPFFKCCKYSKTQPAKMLNMNPGLRDITHSITGGSIVAQGYWMPFNCAKAVCATFCASIAGALIPIFGPDFPGHCVSPDAPGHGRMAIDPAIIAEAAREADIFRRMYANANAVASNNHIAASMTPTHHHQNQYTPHPTLQMPHTHHYTHGPALPSPTSIPSPRVARRALVAQQQRWGSPLEVDRDQHMTVGYDSRVHVRRGPDSPYSEPDLGGPGSPSLHLHQHMLNNNRGSEVSLYSPLSPPRSSGHSGGSGWAPVNNSSAHCPSKHAAQSQPASYHGLSSAYREPDLLYTGSIQLNPMISPIPGFSLNQHQRSTPAAHPYPLHRLAPVREHWHEAITITPAVPKRPAAVVEADDDYTDKSSPSNSVTLASTASRGEYSVAGCYDHDQHQERKKPAVTSADSNAALALMNLSMREARSEDCTDSEIQPGGGRPTRGCGLESMSMSPVLSGALDGHRSKRRRATSL